MSVHLVGAGPGDPGLLTRRGAELLELADVVIHDRLVDPRVLALVNPRAELVDVGKRPGATPSSAQADLHELLVTYGLRGGVVVRLQGGDPLLFGRGGEELDALFAAGIEAEVVPGVSSALGVPASLGMPLTHRGLASAVTIVSGHDVDAGSVDWSKLSDDHVTLVVLMGVAQRRAIRLALVGAGRSPVTPCAVIERGTTPSQRIVHTTLGALDRVDVDPPAVLVIGEVARARGGIGATRPLTTRPVAAAI
jgi:uroporphyrin-III C-methyltransferase